MTNSANTSSSTAMPTPKADPRHPFTLAIDIGGTGLKASVLDADGAMVADRVKIPTTYPLSPEKLMADLAKLVAPLPDAERASVGSWMGSLSRQGGGIGTRGPCETALENDRRRIKERVKAIRKQLEGVRKH